MTNPETNERPTRSPREVVELLKNHVGAYLPVIDYDFDTYMQARPKSITVACILFQKDGLSQDSNGALMAFRHARSSSEPICKLKLDCKEWPFSDIDSAVLPKSICVVMPNGESITMKLIKSTLPTPEDPDISDDTYWLGIEPETTHIPLL